MGVNERGTIICLFTVILMQLSNYIPAYPRPQKYNLLIKKIKMSHKICNAQHWRDHSSSLCSPHQYLDVQYRNGILSYFAQS